MKFLLDQGLARSTVRHLATMGLAAEHVGDLGLAQASDERILEEGRARGAIVVTLDSDFHSLLAHSNATTPSVIRIRVEGLKGDRTQQSWPKRKPLLRPQSYVEGVRSKN